MHIMDGVVAIEGNGPTSGIPVEMHVLLFSADPVALDSVFASLINLSPAFSDWLSGLPHFRAIVDAVTFSLPEVKSAAFYFCGGVARL